MTAQQTISLQLTEDERDCLQELMNISYGEATAAIGKVIGEYATLGIPKIAITSSEEFKEYFLDKFDNNNTYYVSNQSINGDVCGENMFIMDEASLLKLSQTFEMQEEQVGQDELKEVLLDISNMLTTTTLNKLGQLLEAKIIFSPPSSKIIHQINNLHNRYETQYNQLIVVSTNVSFEEKGIEGELLIITEDKSFMYIKQALQQLLEEF